MRTMIVVALLAACAPGAEGQSRPPRELGPVAVALNTASRAEPVVFWQPVQKAAAYELERCEGPGLTTCAIKTTSPILAGQPLQVRDNLSASGSYLYRVTAYGSRQLPIAQGQVGYVYTALTAVPTLSPGGTATPMTPPGPEHLTAVSPIPGQIHLSWVPVPNAKRYQVYRFIAGVSPERELPPPGTDPSGNTPARYIDAPVDFRWTYSYRIYAYVPGSTADIRTTSSPIATRQSLPFVQVSGLSYTLVPSIQDPGRVDLTLRWTGVPNVEKYIVWDKSYLTLLREVFGTQYVERSLPTKWGFIACVGAQYPYNLRDGKTEPCIEIKT